MFDVRGQFGVPQAAPRAAARFTVPDVESPIFSKDDRPEAVWEGVFYGLSGYAKSNREVALRTAGSVVLSIVHAIEPQDYDAYQRARVDLHRRVAVSSSAPQVRFFGPVVDRTKRHKALWTMMETECAHPTMVGLMNDHYDECWTPTKWNADVFKASGLEIPVKVVPLGVDPHTYRPDGPRRLPECRLLTTRHAGAREVPEGFVYIYVFLPSFRKGIDVLLPAFEAAFANDPDASLVLAVTHSTLQDFEVDLPRPEMRSKVYILKGEFTERGMASMYRAYSGYVCASRGEGWNLPMMEAAACGLPVIGPRNSCHPELFEPGGFLFDTEGFARYPEAEVVSPWYKETAFSVLGHRSVEHLTELLRHVKAHDAAARERAAALSLDIRARRTWDAAADIVVERLLEVQP